MTSHPLVLRGRGSTACCLSCIVSFQVTGDGHGGQPLGSQLFSFQPPEPWCQPHPALVTSCPLVLKIYPQLTIRFPYAAPYEFCLSLLYLCTGLRPICTFALTLLRLHPPGFCPLISP
jgi:hypothetical protein